MPIPPVLSLNAFSALPLQVHEIVAGTTPTQLGADVSTGTPVAYVPSLASKANMQGFAKTFKGERYCLTIAAGTYHIRRENEGGAGVWGIVYTFVISSVSTAPECFGLHIVKDGNDVALVTGFTRGAAPNAVVWAKSNTGQTASWTEVSVDPGFTPRISTTTVVFRNRLYVGDGISTGGGAPARVYEVDVAAGTLAVISAPWFGGSGTGFMNADLCVAFDKLWCVAQDAPGTANGVLTLYEFTGGGWSLNSQIGATLGHNPDGVGGPRGKYCLWTDNANLYVVGYTEKDEANTAAQLGSTVWRGVPLGASFTWAQSDTTMVSSLRPGVRGVVTAAREDRWSVYVDNDTDPANPAYYLIVAQGAAPGTGHAVYRWEGFGFEMGAGANTGESGPGASVGIAFAFPEMKHGGGEAISQGIATFGEIEVETAIAGAYRLSYRTPGAIVGLTGRVYYSLGQGPPDQLATLVGGLTTFGPITGDVRALLRTIDVSLSLSGITNPDESNWMIDLR